MPVADEVQGDEISQIEADNQPADDDMALPEVTDDSPPHEIGLPEPSDLQEIDISLPETDDPQDISIYEHTRQENLERYESHGRIDVEESASSPNSGTGVLAELKTHTELLKQIVDKEGLI